MGLAEFWRGLQGRGVPNFPHTDTHTQTHTPLSMLMEFVDFVSLILIPHHESFNNLLFYEGVKCMLVIQEC